MNRSARFGVFRADHFGLAGADLGLGQGVIVSDGHRLDSEVDAGLEQAFGEGGTDVRRLIFVWLVRPERSLTPSRLRVKTAC